MSLPTARSPTEFPPLPSADLEIADRRKLRFTVMTKEKKGAQWMQVFEGSLVDAYEFASTQVAFEVALFNDGIFYWSTRDVALFNDTLTDAKLDVRVDQRRTEQF